MKILADINKLLAIASIVFIFINWKIAIVMILVAGLIHAFLLGPEIFFSAITTYLFIGGIVYFFFDWRIAVLLIVAGFLMVKFHIWVNFKIYEYYNGGESIEEDY